ncbi:hypothetical protein [Pendulispora albinea]|uniref:Uncharacterized protein n=1 Tax=Pendulispora albinea TaxID=2741071 RepID=A0ABZ2LKP7_9BACT
MPNEYVLPVVIDLAASRTSSASSRLAAPISSSRPRDLVRVLEPSELPRRPIWLVGHPTSLRAARVRAVWDHLTRAFERDAPRLRGELGTVLVPPARAPG